MRAMTTTRRLLAAAALTLALLAAPARASAPAGRYVLSNMTVQDTKTRLTWQRGIAPMFTWTAASEYCAAVAGSLGGTGWRMPTIKELLTLVDDSQTAGPTIDQTAFASTPASFFWSSTYQAGSTTIALGVNFTDGNSGTATTSTSFYVRCVR
jgi:hypothetical protein